MQAHRLAHRDDHVVVGGEIVPSVRIGGVNPERILFGDFMGIHLGEFAVGSGVTQIPAELLAHNGHLQGIGRRGFHSHSRPHFVSVNRQCQKNKYRDGRPNDLQGVVTVAVNGPHPCPMPVFYDKINHGAEDQHGRNAGQPEDHVKDEIDFMAKVGNVAGQPPDPGLPDFSPTCGTAQPENPHEPQAHPLAKSRHGQSLLWILKDSTPLRVPGADSRAGSFPTAIFRGKSDG